MTADYTHGELNKEIRAISGFYTLTKEVRLPMEGRELFYITGYSVFDTSCCGTGGCGYAIVPGFILDWKGRKNKDGQFISRVESVTDPKLQNRLKQLITEKEIVQQIRFE